MKPLTLIDKAFLLKRTPLFSMLDLDLLLTIADKLGSISYEAGERVFVSNEEANRMYFIVSGQIRIFLENNTKPVCTLHANNFFGEESLFNDRSRDYEAQSLTSTQLLTLSRTNLYTIISECPSVAVGFLQAYASALAFRPFKSNETE